MGNRHIIDTNVLIVANGRNLAADISPQCQRACAQLLNRIRQTGAIAINANWQILNEYSYKVHPVSAFPRNSTPCGKMIARLVVGVAIAGQRMSVSS